MEATNITVGDSERAKIEAIAIKCGDDYSVTICGGERYHVGAVAHATPCRSVADESKLSASVSTIVAFGHKDDEVARNCAKMLAIELGCLVSVSVGIHIDNATSDEITVLSHNCREACQLLINQVKGAR